MHRDIVPIGEFLGDAAIAGRIVLFEIVQRGVGEHHPEAEGVVGTVALVDRDLGLRPLLPEQDRGVQAGRPATDDRDLHESLRLCNPSNYFKPKAFSRQGPSPADPGFAALHPATFRHEFNQLP